MSGEGAAAGGGEAVVLVVGSGMRRYREYLLSSAGQRHKLWLLDAAEPSWQHDYVAGATVVDTRDPAALVRAAREVALHREVSGLICYDELLIESAAHVVAALGLRGMTGEAVARCRDKDSTRATLREAGVLQPRSVAVSSLPDALEVASGFGYPVVLKPRNLGASYGVSKAADADALAVAFAAADAAQLPGIPRYADSVLVEEYVDGPEISIDGFVFDGEYQPLFVARKRLGLEPYFEETGHIVDGVDPLLDDAGLRTVLVEAHRALGVDYSITHTEVRLTDRGPVIIEVNARLGGDFIPYVGWLATGIDPGHVAVDVAIGRRPVLAPSRKRTVGIEFCYPRQNCRVLSVQLPDPDRTPGLLSAEKLVEPGTEMRLPPDGYVQRYAYVICAGADRAECEDRLAAAAEGVQLEWTELSA